MYKSRSNNRSESVCGARGANDQSRIYNKKSWQVHIGPDHNDCTTYSKYYKDRASSGGTK